MKWFKHYSDMFTNPKVRQICNSWGPKERMKAYGCLMRLIEIMTYEYRNKKRPVFILNKDEICQELHIRWTRVRQLVDNGSTCGFWYHTEREFELEINFPKLLEIKDNHTKSLEVTKKQLGPKIVEVDVEVDVEKEKKINKKKNSETQKPEKPNTQSRASSTNKSKNNFNKTLTCEVIEHLNKKAGQSYKPTTKKTVQLVKARSQDGFNLDDFKLVIDNMWRKWSGTEMQQYFRPETLFGNKFESYLQDAKSNKGFEDKLFNFFLDQVNGDMRYFTEIENG